MAGFEPIKLRTDSPVVEEEREPFFYLDDREFTIPKRIAPATTLQFLEEAGEHGEAAGLTWLLRELLGDDAVDALKEPGAVDDEQMAVLMGYIQKKALAATRKQLGNSRGGQRR